jgi:hypothetical protein
MHIMLRLNPHIVATTRERLRLASAVFPGQVLLKYMQVNIATLMKEAVNPWIAFGLMGLLQNVIAAHMNIHFSKQLKVGKKFAGIAGVLKGCHFAGIRDMMSQGIPFMLSPVVNKHVMDKLYPTDSKSAQMAKHWSSMALTSFIATVISQGMQNCIIAMHADHSRNSVGTIRQLWQQNKWSMLYKGAEARGPLVLYVCVLNEYLLKPAWEAVED